MPDPICPNKRFSLPCYKFIIPANLLLNIFFRSIRSSRVLSLIPKLTDIIVKFRMWNTFRLNIIFEELLKIVCIVKITGSCLPSYGRIVKESLYPKGL